jgi:hypothetical protein
LELQAIASFPQHGLPSFASQQRLPFPAPPQEFSSFAAEVLESLPLQQFMTALASLPSLWQQVMLATSLLWQQVCAW